MRRNLFACITALLLAVVWDAQATTRTFGNTGTHATFTAALTAASSGDTLQQVGASTEALGSAYTCTNKALVIIGSTSLTTTVTAYKVTFSGTGNIVMVNFNLTAALAMVKTSYSWTATGCNFKHPGSGTENAATGYGIGVSMQTGIFTSCVFDESLTVGGDYGDWYWYGSTTPIYVTYTSCTFNTCGFTNWAAFSGGYARYINCHFTNGASYSSAWITFAQTADLDSVAFSGCNFACDVTRYSTITSYDVKNIRIYNNLFTSWGLSSLSKGSMFYINPPVTAGRAKSFTVSNNVINRTVDREGGSGSFVVCIDTTSASVITIKNNSMAAANANEIDYFWYGKSCAKDCVITGNSIYAGVMYFGAWETQPGDSDTLAWNLGYNWTFSNNIIDHTDWAPTGSYPSTALTWCPRSSVISNNIIRSDRCNHIVLINDDTITQWRAGTHGYAASSNLIYGNVFDQGPFEADASPLGIRVFVDKGKNNKTYNNHFIQRGAIGVASTVFVCAGDSNSFYNNDITIYDQAGSTGSIYGGARWANTQSKGNLLYNNISRGTAAYCVSVISGDGTGWDEGNNCWALRYLTRFDSAGDSMSTTSFTDSTSWRMDYGGRGGLTGMTDSAEGFQRVGISTTSPGQPAISKTQPGFRHPVEALESIRSIGALKDVTLDMYAPDPQARANLKVWQFSPHTNGAGTFQQVSGDTLQVRRAFQ